MRWDYIIVGAGSAGCALAYELASGPSKKSILILEAGGSDRSPYIKFPAGQPQAAAKHDWGYWSSPDPTRHGVKEKWKRGKVLGGSSSINGTIYVRGAASDFDKWNAISGNNSGGWSAADVMPIFSEMETSDQINPYRGRTGPLFVRTVSRPHPVTQAFMKSAETVGYNFNEDYNGREQVGVSFMQFNQRRGFRWSSADAFLKPLLGREGIKLILGATVEKINIERGVARSVSFFKSGKNHEEFATKVILCAGAINSPKVLLLSGVGDQAELEKLDICTTKHLPAVGRNLQDHPVVRMMYHSKVPTYNLTEGIWQKLKIAASFILRGEGPIANLFEGMGFITSTAAQSKPDLQLFFGAVGMVRTPVGSFALAPFPAITLAAACSYPKSIGVVKLASNRFDDAPLIEFPLLQEREDLDVLIHGIEAIRRIMEAPPMRDLIQAEVVPGKGISEKSEIEAFIRENASICYHSIGTCRMGSDDNSVVDADLKVKGLHNVWVADASVMPSHISANINAACMMIGRKLGKRFNADQPLP